MYWFRSIVVCLFCFPCLMALPWSHRKLKNSIPAGTNLKAMAEMNARTVLHSKEAERSQQDHPTPVSDPKVVCYYPNWGQYRPGQGRFRVDHIDPTICTHLVYAFAKIIGTTLGPYEPNDFQMYNQMQQLKQQNLSLKTMLSIGGATMGNDPFIYVSSTPTRRQEFAMNVIAYVRNHGFDGVDIDWEYPRAQDRTNFSELIKTLKLSFLQEVQGTGSPALQLSAAFAAAEYVITNSYDLPTLSTYLDFANVMSYDLHGGWDPVTGFHSALYGFYSGDKFCQDWVINAYISRGLPRAKIMLGVPTFGRSFTLCNPGSHGVRDCSMGHGNMGPNTLTPGSLAYYEICRNLNAGYTREYDSVQKAPYAYKDRQWVGYDDVQSLLVKKSYMSSEGLGGVVFWDMSMDDFNNQCGSGTYPLIKVFSTPSVDTTTTTSATITSTRFSTTTRLWTFSSTTKVPPTTSTEISPSSPTTTEKPPSTSTTTAAITSRTTSTTQTPSTTSSTSEIRCEYDGQFIRDPNDCSVYYQCNHGNPVRYQCPKGTYFDLTSMTCNWADQVDCPHGHKH